MTTEEGSSASLGKTYLHNFVGPCPDGLSRLHHKVLLAACCRIAAVVSLLLSWLMSRLKLTGAGDFQGTEFIASCGATSTPAVSVSSSAALPIRRPRWWHSGAVSRWAPLQCVVGRSAVGRAHGKGCVWPSLSVSPTWRVCLPQPGGVLRVDRGQSVTTRATASSSRSTS